MASLNRVILIGNVTKDPELRFTPSGQAVTTLRLAVNRRYKNKQGEMVDQTDYFNVVVWARQAEIVGEFVKRGTPVAVEGRLQSRSWEAEDGSKRSAVEVVADNVQFLGRPGKDREETGSAEPADEFPQSEGVPALVEDAEEIPF